MRRTVFALSLAYAILFGWAWFDTLSGSMDAAGRGMALGFLTVGIGITALFVIPALILAVRNMALNWALGLACAPPVLAALLTMSGLL